ncbi:MAG: response regulator [Polyangiaceae bacterium]|nr:response regulator [Polyangiaceae bacterium]
MARPKRSAADEQPHRSELHSGFLRRSGPRPPRSQVPGNDDTETDRLLLALRTHQIELELQSEELHEARRALADARDQFADLYDGAPVGYITMTGEGVVSRANLRFAAMVGAERASVEGRLFSDFIQAEDQEDFHLHRQALRRRAEPQCCEFRLVRLAAEPIWVSLESVVVDDGEHGTVVRSAVRDITAWKEAEAKQDRLREILLQSQKLEAIGTLAGGVAHDMNNILAVIMALGCRLEGSLSDEHPHLQDVRDIMAAVARGSKLTQNLLDYAHRSARRIESCCVNDVVERLLAVLNRTTPKRINIQSSLEQELAFVDCDPDQLTQMLMNICLNSVDAIAEYGTITIATRNVRREGETLAGFPELLAGSYVSIQVSDDGCGMDDATQRRACEPFFTTKEVGKGTGLGLSMVCGVVEELGGALRVTSEVERGTTIRILLPSRSVGLRRRSQHPGPIGTSAAGRTVLVVDDESLVRTAFRHLLHDLGYSVMVAESGYAAIEAYQADPNGIDVVLLDLSMPTMDGAECFSRLRELNPYVKVVFCTGRARGEAAARIIADREVPVLSKPCRMEELAAALAQAIEEPLVPSSMGQGS